MGIKRTRSTEGGGAARRRQRGISPQEQALRDATRNVFLAEGLGHDHSPAAAARRAELAEELGDAIRTLRGRERR